MNRKQGMCLQFGLAVVAGLCALPPIRTEVFMGNLTWPVEVKTSLGPWLTDEKCLKNEWPSRVEVPSIFLPALACELLAAAAVTGACFIGYRDSTPK